MTARIATDSNFTQGEESHVAKPTWKGEAMHYGQWLINDGDATTKVFTPWFPRGGDNAIMTYEIITSLGGTFTVDVVHKNKDDTGNGSILTPSSAFTVVSGTSFYEGEFAKLKELVRFQVSLVSGTTAIQAVLYRMLAPTWFNDVGA